MTTDTIAKIKAAERDAAELAERTRSDGAQRLRVAKAECDKRIAEEGERLRLRFDEEQESAKKTAESRFDEEESASLSEAEKFVRTSSARLPDAVRFIVGRIIGKWQ